MRYSGFWRRVGAYLLDSLIVLIPLNLLLTPLGLSAGARGLLGSVGFLLYGPPLILARGQTIGMRVARIICRMVDGTKATASAVYTRALVRVLLGSGSYLAYLIAPPANTVSGTALTPAQTRVEQRFIGLFLLFAVPLFIDLLWMRRGSR
ncbi:MAG TPA: RDD family protein, partial [Acidimicrobiales bacterium]|nr:RDD family protein [Acidimicrobiales bacterium]